MSQGVRAQINFTETENIIIISVASVGIIFSLSYCYLFLVRQRLRKSPGDIYLGMGIAEGLLALHQLINTVERIVTHDEHTEAICDINSILVTISIVLIYSYSVQLYIQMIVRLQFALKQQKIQKWRGHAYSWAIAILYCVDLGVYHQYGIDPHHFCGTILSTFTPFTFLVFILAYLMISVSTLLYLKHEVAHNSSFKKQAKRFISFITIFMVVQLLVYVAIEVCIMVVAIKIERQKYSDGQLDHTDAEILRVTTYITEYIVLSIPLVFPLSRLLDQDMRKKLFYTPKKKEESQINNPLLRSNFLGVSALGKSKNEKIQLTESKTLSFKGKSKEKSATNDNHRRITLAVSKFEALPKSEHHDQDDEEDKSRRSASFSNRNRAVTQRELRRKQSDEFKIKQIDQDPFMHNLSSHIRSIIMKRILCFLIVQEKDKVAQHLQQQLPGFKRLIKRGKNQGFQDRHIYIMSALEQLTLFGYAFENVQFKSLGHKFFNMISYAQSIFDLIIEHDQENLDLMESLDLEKNEFQIKECSQTSGGKSGEFFFFTHDNKFVLKTISSYEVQVLMKRLESYFWHVTHQKLTYLAKIVGVFTFEGFETGPIQFVLMKNVVKVPKHAIERIYDLKGSSYDREVLRKNTLRTPIRSLNPSTRLVNESFGNISFNGSDIPPSKVLKDLDFINIEERVHVSESERQQILEQILEDTMFLKQQGLMDYSLVIFKINWFSVVQNEQEGIFDSQLLQLIAHKRASSLLHCYKSTLEEGIYYHIGIIDYLQTYNTKKMLEKFAKKVMNLNAQLDTSSQDPRTYQMRFMRFMQAII